MKVIIQKPDLDTCLTALIMGVTAADEIIVSRGEASAEELEGTDVLCIEAGGSGLVELNNFDHHDVKRYHPPACRQAYEHRSLHNTKLNRLVGYVCMVDDRSQEHPPVDFPSLSNIFSGMLFVERTSLSQFLQGMEILQQVIDQDIDPFGTMPDLEQWRKYRDAKAENMAKLAEILKKAVHFTTAGGLTVGYTESDIIGGIGALYGQGCDIVIMFNPTFGDPPVRKYTIAGNNVSVIGLLPHLEQVEKGWGGRETIIGSPRIGSALLRETVMEIVEKAL